MHRHKCEIRFGCRHRLTRILALFITSLTIVIGCGSEKSTDQQADEFYDEKLNSADTKTCNSEGHLYDALESKCKTDVKLATWECSRAGVASQADDAAGMTELDAFINDGFNLHQCGETASSGEVYLMLVNKGKTSKEASLEIRRVGLNKRKSGSSLPVLKAGALSGADSLKVGECQLVGVETPEAVTAAVVLTLKAADDIAVGTLKTYSDEDCTDEAKTLTIKKGKTSVNVYYKLFQATKSMLEVSAKGYESLSHGIFAD